MGLRPVERFLLFQWGDRHQDRNCEICRASNTSCCDAGAILALNTVRGSTLQPTFLRFSKTCHDGRVLSNHRESLRCVGAFTRWSKAGVLGKAQPGKPDSSRPSDSSRFQD